MLTSSSISWFAGSVLVGAISGTPGAILESLGNGAQLRLTRTSGSAFADFTADSSGNLTISPSSGQVAIGGSVANANDKLYLTGASQSMSVQNLIFSQGQCSTMYSETGTSGAEEAIATNGYVAIKITTNSTFLQLGELRVFLRKTADVNATAQIRAHIYTDVAGAPGASLNIGSYFIYAASLTTSLVQYSIALEQNTLSPSTSYWVVLQVIGQTSGTLYLGYKNAAGSATYATSSDGSSWATSNFFPNFLITNRGYRGAYLRGQSREGAYILSDRYFGASIVSNGSWAITAYGYSGGAVMGSSSSIGSGVYVYSTGGYTAAFRQQGTLADNTVQPCVTVVRNHTLGSYTSSGDILFIQDTSGSTGNLFNVLQGSTSRVVITSAGYLRVADGAVGTPEVSFINESSTGFYRVGSGQLGVSILGALRSRFLATGLELYNQTGPQLRLSGLSTNTGGVYLACVDEGSPTNEGYLAFGAEGTHSSGAVSTWVARATSAGILHCDNGTFTFYSNTSGLTEGATFTPTTALTVSSGGVVVGASIPVTIQGGWLAANGSIGISNADPRLQFNETDAATDAKRHDFINQAGVFVGRFYNDAGSLSHTWLAVYRNSGTYTADYALLSCNLQLGSGYDILNADGTASTPSYSFASDTNTGFYSSGADLLSVSVGGTERARFSGNTLMLGTTTTTGSARLLIGNELTSGSAAVAQINGLLRVDTITTHSGGIYPNTNNTSSVGLLANRYNNGYFTSFDVTGGDLSAPSAYCTTHGGNVGKYYQASERLQAFADLSATICLEIEVVTPSLGYTGGVSLSRWRLVSRDALYVTRTDENGGASNCTLVVASDDSKSNAHGVRDRFVVGVAFANSVWQMAYLRARWTNGASSTPGKWIQLTEMATATPTTNSGSGFTFSGGNWVANTGFTAVTVTELVTSGKFSTLTLTGAATLVAQTWTGSITLSANNTHAIGNTTTGLSSISSNLYGLPAGDGNGIRFWNHSTNYQIYMAAQGFSGAGRLDSTSDYNMYFRMAGGSNRGFVFQTGTTSIAQIDSTGLFYGAGALLRQSSGSSIGLSSTITGNSNPTFLARVGGTLEWGPGNAATDVNLYRVSADLLGTDDSFYVAGNLGIGTTAPEGKLHVNGRIHLTELGTNPTAAELTSSSTYNYKDRVALYMKADKLVIAYNHSGTTYYLSIPLDGPTGTTTWSHSLSAP